MDEKKSTELVLVTETRGRAAADPGRPSTRRRSRPRSGASTSPSPKSSNAGSPAARRKHTQRAYRQDVMDFVRFLGLLLARGIDPALHGLGRGRS